MTRALASLLRPPLEEVVTLQSEVKDRVGEILALLDEAAAIDRRTA